MKQQKWIIWIICGAILLGAGFWYTKGQDPVTKESNFQASVSESSAPAGDTSKPVNTDSSEIAVFICGAVKHPGVYRFSESVRICDVIASAGGLTKKADTNAVNQARFVQDGEQIEIPRRSKTAKDQPRAESAVPRSRSFLFLQAHVLPLIPPQKSYPSVPHPENYCLNTSD